MTSRAENIHQARIYLAQARATPWLGWKATLIEWAGKRRLMAMSSVTPAQPAQGELF